jgi:hypothetical protein
LRRKSTSTARTAHTAYPVTCLQLTDFGTDLSKVRIAIARHLILFSILKVVLKVRSPYPTLLFDLSKKSNLKRQVEYASRTAQTVFEEYSK